MPRLPERLPPIRDEVAHDQARRARRAEAMQRDRRVQLRRWSVRLTILAAVVFLIARAGLPSWLDPRVRADFDAWVLTVLERNDAIDNEARTLIPNRHIVMDPAYVDRLAIIGEKKAALLAEVRAHPRVWWRRGAHTQLALALEDSSRHLRALDNEYRWTNAQFAALLDSGRTIYPEDAYAVFYQLSQQYPGSAELQMGKAYQRAYDALHAMLGLEPVAVWPP